MFYVPKDIQTLEREWDTMEKKRKILWGELLEAMDRDDAEAFRNALAKRDLPIPPEEWTEDDALDYCRHFVLTHSEEDGECLLRIYDALKKYCPGEWSAAGKVCPLSHWDFRNW